MNTKRGFSLIEILVVVLIIGVLTSMALPGYEKAQRKAKFAEVEMIFNSMMKTMDASAMETGFPGKAYGGMLQLNGYTCSMPTTDIYRCTGRTGFYDMSFGSPARIIWQPSNSIFLWVPQESKERNRFAITRTIDTPWTWTNEANYGEGIRAYSETFQLFCDWWIKQGGRPYGSYAKTVADERCGV